MLERTFFNASQSMAMSLEGEVIVSNHGLSVRYDIDPDLGVIARPDHDLYGMSVVNKIIVFKSTKGGVSTGWALLNLRKRGTCPAALVCDMTNPVFVQGAVLAGIPIMDGFTDSPRKYLKSGDRVLFDGARRILSLKTRA
ncbi:DUF126 domain-containing protein [Paraburkholderia sp. Ac-20342]|uniref:aconitase X swivel domain-containing protein n=2 Tax=Burkholderiales TaxID=80840 RepID=UPI00197DC68B|nr:DUF126 domain-containing protein [Paraburkholderia sp. Ac-20342]MBN3846154.1 DUF126 domain-containing protein [Paraburkholderia sp. Ac-20342]